jgi:hypothetical protein
VSDNRKVALEELRRKKNLAYVLEQKLTEEYSKVSFSRAQTVQLSTGGTSRPPSLDSAAPTPSPSPSQSFIY